MEELKNFFADPLNIFWIIAIASFIFGMLGKNIYDVKKLKKQKEVLQAKYAGYLGHRYLVSGETNSFYCLDRNFSKDDFISAGNFEYLIPAFQGDYLPVVVKSFDMRLGGKPICKFEVVEVKDEWKMVFKGFDYAIFQNEKECEICFPVKQFDTEDQVGDKFIFDLYRVGDVVHVDFDNVKDYS